jgi:hypothetical protein
MILIVVRHLIRPQYADDFARMVVAHGTGGGQQGNQAEAKLDAGSGVYAGRFAPAQDPDRRTSQVGAGT